VIEREWAKTSITVWRGTPDSQVHDMVGRTLEEQLLTAESWLTELADSQPEGAAEDLEVRLLCSWTPSDGQRAMTLPPPLVRALAKVNGTFWMDVYPPED